MRAQAAKCPQVVRVEHPSFAAGGSLPCPAAVAQLPLKGAHAGELPMSTLIAAAPADT